MKTVTYACDNKGCKFQTQDKKLVITYIKYIDEGQVSRKGKRKLTRVEEHFCNEDCLRKAKGFKELTVSK